MKARRRKPAKATVRKASLPEAESFYGMRLKHYLAEVDGVPLAMGTLSNTGGRVWGWLDVKEGLSPRQALAVVYAVRKGLRKVGEPAVYVTSSEGIHPRALNLLRAIGFAPTGETVNGKDIWKWQS